jgi:diaminopimelate epimerase
VSLYSGCGNTFVLIDNRDGALTAPLPQDCSRADGVIFAESSSKADIRMRIFNSDGKETEMCGNGVRCLVRFLEDSGETRTTLKIETLERTLTAHNHGDMIAVEMGDPIDIRWNEQVSFEGKQYLFHHLNTGVPHAITFMNLPSESDLTPIGSGIRHHPHYAPKGANVNFATIGEDGIVNLRTYERGVEAETEACGTGACAAALAAHKLYRLESPVAIRTKSREILYISFKTEDEHFSGLTLTGPAGLV